MIIASIIENGAVYALTGAFTGFMSGALGIGGGMIVVPALLYIFHHTQVIPLHAEMHVAAGSSLAIMIFTALSSIRAHHREGEILWHLFKRLWPGLFFGTIVGALVADQLSTYWLKTIFGILLLVIALKMLWNVKTTHRLKKPGTALNALVTTSIGVQSGLLGVGGGTFIIPYLTYCGINPQKIPAISALCTLVVAVIGTIAFVLTGLDAPALPSHATGYVFWPAVIWVAIPSILFAPIGAKMTYALPVQQLKYGLVAILLIAAVDMLI